MHSSILYQVMQSVFDFIFNYQLPWDDLTFTIWDVFQFSLFGFVVCFFLANTVGLFTSRIKGMYVDWFNDEIDDEIDDLLDPTGSSFGEEYYEHKYKVRAKKRW